MNIMIGDLDMMEDKVDNPIPLSTPQVIPSFEVYTPPMTYPKEVEETLETSMEEEPLDQTKLEDVGDLDMMEDKVDNPSPLSTPQVLPSFEVYTPPVTYLKEVEETLETPMEEEPLDQTKLEDVGLTNHNISLSSRKVPSFD
ncbi:hypothetical protein Tco_1351466 [Tanacetum coccineum]